ncbi:MAG: transglutaminase domain-containing protein [Xanthomonadaceae bacterium]|nr:transglutaminase domain-containing protein [Xanthomonadaceae bacterium]
MASKSTIEIRKVTHSEKEYQIHEYGKLLPLLTVPVVETTSFITQASRWYARDSIQLAADANFEWIVSELKKQKSKLATVKDTAERKLRTACLVKCFTSNWIEYDDQLLDEVYDYDIESIAKKVGYDLGYRASNILFERKGVCTQFSVAATKLLFRLGVHSQPAFGDRHAFNGIKAGNDRLIF